MNVSDCHQVSLGPVTADHRIASSLAPFHRVPVRIRYPEVVVQALGELYAEYCRTLAVPEGATRHDTDFQYCTPAAFAVQIDMAGLTEDRLAELAAMPADEVRDVLRGQIFEIESSIAMYQLLERLFATEGRASAFGDGWRTVLDNLRHRHGKPVALLAVTDEKFAAMMETEFGADPSARLTSDAVRELTGFDAFFGPAEFKELVRAHDGECPYLLFVRASDPVSRLRKPGEPIEHPLLGDPELRRIIRANTVTLNVDDPTSPLELCVNDTKSYMPDMGLGFAVMSWEDLQSAEFESFLKSRGIEPQDVHEGRTMLRAKPLVAAYGGYGHLRGFVTDKKFRSSLRRELNRRGGYIVQPELDTPMVADPETGVAAGFIDRLFFGLVDGVPFPIGGFRNFMPVGSGELEAGRIHGNGQAFWGEIHLR